jgi:hypothetical protein
MKGKTAKNEIFAALCEALPKGFSKTVVERLAVQGITVSTRSVQFVANGTYRNHEIEIELLKLLDERPRIDFEAEIKKRLENPS